MVHHQAMEYRLICLLFGYLLGSFLTAELVAKAYTGQGARKVGNGNPGMANFLTTLGTKAGVLVLIGDIIKTAAACGAGFYLGNAAIGHTAMLYAGAGAVLGHDFSLWHRGYGGKGVAATCVWLILYLPFTGVLCCLAGGAMVLWSGYLPLGAIAIAIVAIPVSWLQFGGESALVMTAAAIIMIQRHRNGLCRIYHGTEPKYFSRFG